MLFFFSFLIYSHFLSVVFYCYVSLYIILDFRYSYIDTAYDLFFHGF